ncbi:MAG: hypothetical protein HF981_04760 [Desulfobacteraceae bacterium]|nr:hypothetical protein [Desulfobacteraceae bacterium]MBC2749676.1 hypothetical protein [Desulfobacteraceae bacterium]
MAAARIRDELISRNASSSAEVRAAGNSPDLLAFRMETTHYARLVLLWQAQKFQALFEPFLRPALPMINEVKNNRQDAFETETLNRSIIFGERT